MVTLDMIETLEIFETLDKNELDEVFKICTSEEYQSGEMLFRENEDAKDMWIVKDGEVQLRFERPDAKPSTNESTMSSHHNENPESQVFGWSCFIPPYKMRLSAYCVSRRCKVIKINSSKLNKLMDSNPVIGYKIVKYIVQVVGFRFKQMQDEVAKFVGMNMMNSW